MEDKIDLDAARKIIAKGEPQKPWAEVKKDLEP